MAAQPTVMIVVDHNPGFLKSAARLLTVYGLRSHTDFAVRRFTSAEALLKSSDEQTAAWRHLDSHVGAIPAVCIAPLKKPFAPEALLDSHGRRLG